MIVNEKTFLSSKEILKDIINKKCIIRHRWMPSSIAGEYYTWQFYLRRGLFDVEFLENLAICFLYKFERIDENFNFQLSGLETAATPMLSSLPILLKNYGVNINSFVVRKDKKTYGMLNWIEGIPNKKPIVIIDDLCNSGFSMKRCHDILKYHNLKIFPKAFSIVNKSNKNIHDAIRLNTDMFLTKEIEVVSVFDLDDFKLTNPSH